MSGQHFSEMEVKDVISGQRTSLSLIIIPTSNDGLHFSQELVKYDKCALLVQKVSAKYYSAVSDFWKSKNDSTKKKKIWLNYLAETTFETSEPADGANGISAGLEEGHSRLSLKSLCLQLWRKQTLEFIVQDTRSVWQLCHSWGRRHSL